MTGFAAILFTIGIAPVANSFAIDPDVDRIAIVFIQSLNGKPML